MSAWTGWTTTSTSYRKGKAAAIPSRHGSAHIAFPNELDVFVTGDGTECSFRGTYLEVEPPIRTVETWLFDGWPDAEAVETMELHETDGVTTLTMRLAFRDKAGIDLKGTSPS
ncbi:MAG TPA: SRPBCC domain-containing protein [Nakamurella sp.]